MGYPELDRDESIILETRNVKYKSISFDAILTNKRIILSDSKKNVIPSQHIALSTIRNVESGENAIRDHFLILAITTDAGERQQAVLTFVRSAGGERKRECKEWEKKLKNLITSSSPETPAPAVPVPEDVLRVKREVVQESTQTAAATTRPAKKKIEIVRPLGTIIEKSPVAPVPVETSSLPTGTFCSRCGSRVPFKSPFCNHCGTPIINVPAQAQQPPVSGEQVPVPPSPPQPSLPKAPIKPPEVPRVQVPVPKALGSTGETPGSPIDQIIHSIEPLIEDSVPRSQQAPLFKKQAPEPAPKPVVTEVSAESIPQVVWPVLPNSESPVVPSVPPAPEEPVFPPPSPPPPPQAPPAPPAPVLPGKKPNYLGIGILILAILPIIAGLVIVANIMTEPTGVPVVTPPVTTTVTKIPTTVPQVTRTPGSPATPSLTQTQVLVPPNGVWVRASYPGTYIGLIGTAGNQAEVTGTGEKFYPISTTDGIVAAALQKTDGSGDKIVLEIYKNGVMVKRESTTTPKGIVEIQLDLKTLPGESSPNP